MRFVFFVTFWITWIQTHAHGMLLICMYTNRVYKNICDVTIWRQYCFICTIHTLLHTVCKHKMLNGIQRHINLYVYNSRFARYRDYKFWWNELKKSFGVIILCDMEVWVCQMGDVVRTQRCSIRFILVLHSIESTFHILKRHKKSEEQRNLWQIHFVEYNAMNRSVYEICCQ